ncbi:MAG: TIGR02757 family protein [Flavobacteriaceae bacterium]|nr:TIGR02757 family protein [Flavobacteriaceae bacterium]
MKAQELKDFLDEKVALYNSPTFIDSDPIQIPHLYQKKEDIEIIAFLVATIAWGNRKSIINNGHRLVQLMGNTPYDFIMNHSETDLAPLTHFVHRTFNGDDLTYFIRALKYLYLKKGGLESAIAAHTAEQPLQHALSLFKKDFFALDHLPRTEKHVSDPLKNSAAKRLNMFLRWMVRPNTTKVDFGIWKSISPAQLSCPLDVHSGNVARKLGLLKRKQNDAKALAELDDSLRKLDPEDPVKYDFALFGLGVFEKF